MTNKDESKYKIGAVANLTGLPAETIRTWERRYRLIEPQRTKTGMRLYSREDIRILQLVRELSNKGEALSSLAQLGREELQARVHQHNSSSIDVKASPLAEPRDISLGLIGEQLCQIGDRIVEDFASEWRLEWKFSSVSSLDGLAPVSGVVFELKSLDGVSIEGLIKAVQKSGTTLLIAIYDFLSTQELRDLEAAGIHALKGPLRPKALLQKINDYFELTELRTKNRGLSVMPPFYSKAHDGDMTQMALRFSRSQLAQLSEVQTSIACECPSQLSSLISGMIAFEEYSYTCESKNVEDAELHRLLAVETGSARRILEELLLTLCASENIEIPLPE